MECMGERRDACRFWWGYLSEGDQLENPGLDRRIILKCIFKKCDGEARIGLVWLRTETGGGCF